MRIFSSCEYFFPSYKFRPKVQYLIKNKIFNGPKNEVILTIPHKCLQDNQKINHNCDTIANEMAIYINEYLSSKYTTILLETDKNRANIDDNRVNASVGMTKDEFINNNQYNIDKFLQKTTIELPNVNSTKLWKTLIDKIKNDSIKLLLDIHSYHENILYRKNQNTSCIIFYPDDINNKMSKILTFNNDELLENNIKILLTCPDNYVNAITEICNQYDIPSLLLEFNETKKIEDIKNDITIFLNILINNFN